VALGLPTNKEFFIAALQSDEFVKGGADTAFLSNHAFQAQAPDLALAANLLAADYGEWTGWSNNPAHCARARFAEEILEFRIEKTKQQLIHVVDGDTLHYAQDGASFTLRNTLYDPPEKKDIAASEGRLLAPMNGRVVSVNAKVGDTVDKGKPLVVLEAMKMEHGLNLPFSVVVKAIHVKAGAQVAPTNLLIEFEPA
jgi:acetyl/propionyl-CoA carboxylase alpha subunit